MSKLAHPCCDVPHPRHRQSQTVRENFPSYSFSVYSHLILIPARASLMSLSASTNLAWRSSWQCRWRGILLLRSLLFRLRSIWSTSRMSSSLKCSSHQRHFPCCFCKSRALVSCIMGCVLRRWLQYTMLPSYGEAFPFTFVYLWIAVFVCIRSSAPSGVANTYLRFSTWCQYFLTIHWVLLLECLAFAQRVSWTHKIASHG